MLTAISIKLSVVIYFSIMNFSPYSVYLMYLQNTIILNYSKTSSSFGPDYFIKTGNFEDISCVFPVTKQIEGRQKNA
jgi:hypothetical protein